MSTERFLGNLKSQEKLKGSANYLSWKRRIEQTLAQAGVLEYALGIEKGEKPTTSIPNEKLGIGNKESVYIVWFTGNAHAYSIIEATCGSETVETIRLTVDAAEAWKLLQNRYEGKGNFVLTKGFDDWHALSLDPEDIAAFNIRFKNINSQLSGAGLDVPPVMSMLHYLNVVQATFPNWADKYRGKMRKYQPGSMPTIEKLDDLMDRLLEESRAHTVANNRAIALYGNQLPKRGGHTGRMGGRGGGRGGARQALASRPRESCDYCGRDRHLEAKCWKKHPDLKPPYIKAIETAQKPEAIALIAAFVTNGFSKRPDWILDTGASHHMCNDRTLFENYIQNSSSEMPIDTAAGPTRAEGIGAVRLKLITSAGIEKEVRLEQVYHLPELSVNLLSANRIGQKGFYIDGLTHTIRKRTNGDELCAFVETSSHMRILTKETQVQAFAASTQKPKPMLVQLWHRRLGHLGMDNVIRTANATTGITFEDVKDPPRKTICKPCVLAKSLRTQSKKPQTQAAQAFDRIHIDVIGPIKPKGIDGSEWAILMTDDKTRCRWVYPLQRKGDAHRAIVNFCEMIKTQYGSYPKSLRMDNGTEYGGGTLKAYCSRRGISIEFTVPYTPEQDGVSERTNRTIIEKTRTMIIEIIERKAHLAVAALTDDQLKAIWPEIIKTAVYITNRTATLNSKATPLELLHSEQGATLKPDLSHMRIIGCNAHYHIHKEKRVQSAKFGNRSNIGILIGYEGNTIYRIYDPERGVIRASAVVFEEDSTPAILTAVQSDDSDLEPYNYKADSEAAQPLSPATIAAEVRPPEATIRDHIAITHENEGESLDTNLESDNERTIVVQRRRRRQRPTVVEADDQEDIDRQLQLQASIESDTQRGADVITRRSERIQRSTNARQPRLQRKGSLEANYWALDQRHWAFLSAHVTAFTVHLPSSTIKEPTTYKQAISSRESEHWQAAMKAEYDSLIQNETWQETEPPSGTHVLRGRWVYALKWKDGHIERYKARWVAKGFEQLYGVDYEQTFAGVAKSVAIRILIALAAHFDWEIEQMDAVTAFLNSRLDENVWIQLPTGYENGTRACRLKKGLYGLKQAARLWALEVRKLLRELGYQMIPADECLYWHPEKGVYVATHVDDFLILGANTNAIQELKSQLSKRFTMKDLGQCHTFLGIEISRNRKDRTIHLCQKSYIEKVLRVFGMESATGKATPMEANGTQILKANTKQASEEDIKLFQSIIGSLMYAMIQTRPDIAFAVCFLSRFLSNPTAAHIQAAHRVLRYLGHTKTLGVTYHGKEKGFKGCSDSDWGADINTRSSTSGYLFFLHGGVITWKTGRQKTVALSSTEAEYYGLSNATREALWLRSLLRSLGYDEGLDPVVIEGDNQGSLALTENPEFHQRTKHIDIKHHFLRQEVDEKRVAFSYVETTKLAADGLTKPLNSMKHAAFVQQLRLESWAPTAPAKE